MLAALSRPNLISRSISVIALIGIAIVLYLVVQGGPTYVLNLQMANADGIRPGSQVLLGGVPVGTVSSIDLGRGNLVVARLGIGSRQVKVGRGAHAAIIAANLLGEEYVSLSPGDSRRPLPSGATLPPSATTVPTELDQIVDVFDATNQERLAILINELGIAVAGRKSDVSAILRQLPLSARAANALLSRLITDNHSLRDLVARSEQFIGRIDKQTPDLKRVIGTASGASTTAALQAANLGRTLVQAPTSLITLRRFVVRLGRTAARLTEPAGLIDQAADPLSAALTRIRPFSRAAIPTLDRAAAVAPELTRLGDRATPIVHSALPTVAALAAVAQLSPELTRWTGLSATDVMAALNGWTRAIQFRDGVSHIFHAQLGLSPSVIFNIADSPGLSRILSAALGASSPRQVPHISQARHIKATTGAAGTSAQPVRARPAAGSLGGIVAGSVGAASSVLGRLTGAAPGRSTAPNSNPTAGLRNLLGYLLGK